jgi:rubredoxin
MAEHWTCIECSTLYDDSDGDTDEKMMCNKCIDEIKTEKDIKNDLYGTEVYGKIERRDPNIRRSSTKHYPDWDKINKEYVVPPKQRKEEA